MLNKNSKIAIFGSTGLLGQKLLKEGRARGFDVIGTARNNADICLDITNDKALIDFFSQNQFDVVINTVAIVNHKQCDDNPSLAYLVNARPGSILTQLADDYNFKYVYISTDGYFEGDGNKKHDENTPVKFLNEYAKTKYLGECFALTNPKSLVTRTNIVGFKGAQTPTFFEWALNAINSRQEMTLFDDYFTSSISVELFAKSLYDLIEKNASGLYNLASSEVSSKKEFIEKTAEIFGLELVNASVGSVSSLSSKRADSLGLDVTRAEKVLGYKLPALNDVLMQLKEEYDELQK